MKTKKIILLFVYVILIGNVYSQFIPNGPNFGNTIPTMRGIGIGDFLTNTAVPASRLHVNNFYCNQPNGALSGFLFRTDGRSNVENKWELHTGANNASLTEKFRLFIPIDSFNVHLNASDNSGNMQFQTGGVTRMFINQNTATNNFGVNTAGYIGIGTNVPASPLHIVGRGNANINNWQRALTIQGGSLYFTNAAMTGQGFMMAYPSGVPAGNFFASSVSDLTATGTETFVYQIGTGTRIGGYATNPFNSVQFYRNILISQVDPNIIPNPLTPANERRLGINTLNPQNVVEINTADISASPGKSGLRFQDLTSASNVGTNVGNMGVLSVNASGDVVYVSGGVVSAQNGAWVNTFNQVEFGTNPLMHPTVLPLRNFDLNIAEQGTVHISQGSTNLNTNAALDINTESSSNNIGLNFKGKGGNNLVNEKGIFGEMNLNSLSAVNNAALLELSNTAKTPDARAWLMKANGFYGVTGGTNLVDQASFGVLGNGNVMVNGNLSNNDNRRANFVVNDFENDNNNFNGAHNTMFVSSTNQTGVNCGIEVLVENQTTSTNGIRAIVRADGASTASGVTIDVLSNASTGSVIGEQITANSTSAINVSGTIIYSQGLGNLIQGQEIHAISSTPTSTTNGINVFAQGQSLNSIGVRTHANGAANENMGVYTLAHGPGVNYGIYASAHSGTDNFAGRFEGKVYINGDLTGPTNIEYASDQNLKTNIDTISNSLSIIKKLAPKSFYFDTINNHGFNFSSKKQYGFLAQQIDTVLHELVSDNTKPADYDSLGAILNPALSYKSLNYNAFIAILTDAVQEQQTQIEAKDSIINDLNTRLSRLESCLSSLLPTLCEMNQSAIQQTPQETQRQLAERISISLTDKNTLILTQNVPNPFAEKTVIEYSIPANIGQAQIHFYNAEGKIINSVDIKERGNGELTVFANDLSSGIYTYTLVADGKIVATKKMMKN